jgi:hypothetical protein
MLSFFQSNLHAVEFAPLLFTFSIFIFTAIGWYFGHYRLKKHPEGGIAVRDSLVAAIFGLSALVLGFTFSGSASRYFDRMDSIRAQAQSLQEVYVSLKYLAPSDQAKMKTSLNELLDLRLSAYKHVNSMSEVEVEAKRIMLATRKIQEEVRRAAVNAPVENKGLVADLLIPQVGSLATTYATGIINIKSHPPGLLMKFLFALLCIGAFLIGYTMAIKKEHDWLLATLYTLLMGISLYVILSLEIPNLLMPYEEINHDFLLLKDAMK